MEHQTIRDVLRRKKRWALLALAIGWLSAFSWTFLDEKSFPPYLFGVLGVFLFVGVITLGFFIRCPRCRGNIGTLNAGLSKAIPLYTVMNFCPYCGVSLDTKVGP